MAIPPRSFPNAGPVPRASAAPDARDALRSEWPAGLPVPRLWRSHSNRVLAGVLGGLAEKFGLEPTPLRLLYGVLTFVSGGVLLVPYLALWSITRTYGPPRIGPRFWRSRSSVVVAGVLGGLAEKLGVRPAFVRVPFVALSALTMVFPAVLSYLVLWAVTSPLDAPEGRAI